MIQEFSTLTSFEQILVIGNTFLFFVNEVRKINKEKLDEEISKGDCGGYIP